MTGTLNTHAETLDRAALLGRCGGDEVLAAEVLALFLSEWGDAWRTRLNASDPSARERERHTLMGAARAIGADALAAVLRDADAEPPDLAPHFAALKAEIEQTAWGATDVSLTG